MATSSVAWWLGSVAGGEAGEPADDVDVESRLSGVEAEEVVGTTCGEDRVRGRERDQTRFGHARGGAEEQLLGHADLEEALRHRLREDVHVGVLGQVGAESDDAAVLLGGSDERMPERRGRGFLARVGERGDHRRGLELGRGGLGHRADPSGAPRLSWSRQGCHSSSSMRMKCALVLFSSSGTP